MHLCYLFELFSLIQVLVNPSYLLLFLIFTSQLDHNKPLRRERITKDINKFMGLVSKKLPDQPNLKSHSFWTSFITQLWKDTNDIEFVRQVIGYSKLDTTSYYVQSLSEKEREERMSEV